MSESVLTRARAVSLLLAVALGVGMSAAVAHASSLDPKRVLLQRADLPAGFLGGTIGPFSAESEGLPRATLHRHGWIAGYASTFISLTAKMSVTDGVDTFRTRPGARWLLHRAAGNAGKSCSRVRAAGVGDESVTLFCTSGRGQAKRALYDVVAAAGTAEVSVYLIGRPGHVAAADALGYARVIVRRIHAAQG